MQRSSRAQFFNPTNTVFVVVLAMFALALIADASIRGSSATFARVETVPHFVVNGDSTSGRGSVFGGGWSNNDYIPIEEADPSTPYKAAGRDWSYQIRSINVTGLSFYTLLVVIPVFMALLAAWPLLAAVRARRWLVAVAYVGVMAASCWHAYDVAWRHYPYGVSDAGTIQATPLLVWAVFLMLALAPRQFADALGLKGANNGRFAAFLLVAAAVVVGFSFALNGGNAGRSTRHFTKFQLYELRTDTTQPRPRTFLIDEIDPTTLPGPGNEGGLDAEGNPIWVPGNPGGGRGASSNQMSLAVVALLFPLLVVAVAALSLWPYRILARKRRRFLATVLTCGILAVYVVWPMLTEFRLIRIEWGGSSLEPAPLIVALIVAWSAREHPEAPPGFHTSNAATPD